MQENRKFTRINDNLSLSYNILHSILGVSSHTKDISAGGISFSVMQALEPGVHLDLRLKLADDPKIIKAVARVVWRKKREDYRYPFEVGVVFTSMSQVDQARLLKHVNAAKKP